MKKFITSLMCVVMIVTFMPCIDVYGYVFTPDDEGNHVEVSTTYKLDELDRDNEGDYGLLINIPGDGRIRLWVKDYKKDSYDEYYTISNGNGGNTSRLWKKSVDEMNSGWITVKQETFICNIITTNLVGNETLYIEYQASGSYFGEKEYNDSFATANPLESGKTYEGNYWRNTPGENYPVDCDYYFIQMNSAGLVELRVKNLSESKKNYNVPFELYYEDENQNKRMFYLESASTENGTSSLVRFRVPAGRYYVKIFSRCIMNDEYSISANVIPENENTYEREWNDTSSDANLIESGIKYTGNLLDKEDIDWFKINVDSDSYLTTEFWIPEQMGTDNVQFELYDDQKKALVTQKTNNDAYYKTEPMFVAPGTYYVRVKSGTYGLDSKYDYNLRINASEVIYPVKNLKATLQKYNSVKLTWDKTKGADGYNIYKQKGSGFVEKVGFTTEDEYTVENLSAGSKYSFMIEPCVKKGENYEAVEYALKDTSAYTLKKVSQKAVKRYSSSKVKVSWTGINGKSGYQVYKMTKKNGKYVVVSKYKTTKSYINISAKRGAKYYYKVRAYKNTGNGTVYAPWSAIKSYKL